MNIDPTISPAQAAEREWDAIIVGAGPAGCSSAIGLKMTGKSVLIVEKKAFPRPKVCGGCLNQRAQQRLAELGLNSLVKRFGAVPIDRLMVRNGTQQATIRVPHGVSLSRARLDAELAKRAIELGADFLPMTAAHLLDANDDSRRVGLTTPQGEFAASAKVVLAADGLGGRFVSAESSDQWVSPSSHVGLASTLPAGAIPFARGSILMAVNRAGYVGATYVETGEINVAAAIDPKAIKRSGGAERVILSIWRECGIEARAAETARWLGTAALTRRPSELGCERVFSVGDAAGYIEPFTGQGMAWAMESARQITPIAQRVIESGWSTDALARWSSVYRRTIARRQRLCRTLSFGLRSPTLLRVGMSAVRRFPLIARPFVRGLDWSAPVNAAT